MAPLSRRRLGLAAAAALAARPAAAQPRGGEAAGWPDRPIRILVPFAPGGGNDILARVYGQRIAERLGQSVVVENRPGASGQVGTEAAIRSRADGYTLVVHPSGPVLANAGQDAPAYDLARDLAPIAVLGTFPAYVLVAPDSPHRTLADLVAWERARPGRATYGTGGVTFQIWIEALNLRAGTKFEVVFYRGSIDAISAAAAGDTTFAVADPGPSLPALQGRRARGLAVTTPRRVAAAPDVPTIAEAGFPGLEQLSWIGLFAPAGTPAPILQRLEALVADAARLPEVRERLVPLGMEPEPSSAAAFRATIVEEAARWREIAAAAGVSLSR